MIDLAGTVTFHCSDNWCRNALTLPIDEEMKERLNLAGWGPIENYEPLRFHGANDPPKPLYCPEHAAVPS